MSISKIKTIAIAAVMSPVILASASAETLDVSTNVGFESRYVFRGVQYAETSIQPSINLRYGNFYTGAWFNLPIGDDDFVATPGGEELRLLGGYKSPLNDVLTLDIGFTYYAFPDLMSGFFDVYEEDGDGLGFNTFEPYIGVSFNLPLSPSFYVYHDIFFDTTTLEGKASYSYPLAENASFDLGGEIGYVFDDAGGTDYLYGAATADVNYTVSDNGSLYAGVRYGGSDISGGSIIKDSVPVTTFQSSGFWWGVGFRASF